MKVIDHLYFLAAIKEVPRETARQRIADWLDKRVTPSETAAGAKTTR